MSISYSQCVPKVSWRTYPWDILRIYDAVPNRVLIASCRYPEDVLRIYPEDISDISRTFLGYPEDILAVLGYNRQGENVDGVKIYRGKNVEGERAWDEIPSGQIYNRIIWVTGCNVERM